MDRDMSYDLDAAFAGRNAGELQSVKPSRSRIRRTGGIVVETPDGDPEALDAVEATVVSDVASPYPQPQMAGMGAFSAEVNIPVIGRVNVLHIAIGAAVGVALAMLLRRRPTAATNPRRR